MEVTQDRFIGYIDIMGFKDMVQRNSHEEIYDKFLKIIDDANKLKDNKIFVDNAVQLKVFSDSFLFYTRSSSRVDFLALFYFLSFYQSSLFYNNIPFRGSISFGKTTINEEKSIFFGQPFIDAYLLEMEMAFYGIIYHHTAIKECIEKKYMKRDYAIDCNMKNGKSKHTVLAPFGLMFSEDTDDKDKKAYNYNSIVKSIEGMRLMTSGLNRVYIDNTLNLFKSINRRYEEAFDD